MRVKSNILLYFIMFSTLLYAFPLITQRYSNENRNKSIITTADLDEFMKLSITADLPQEDVLTTLNKNGVKAVSVNFMFYCTDDEITLVSHTSDDTLQKLYSKGFDIILNISFCNIDNSTDANVIDSSSPVSNTAVHSSHYLEYMKELIKKYNIKYLTFEKGVVPDFQNIVEALSGIIKSENLIIGLAESPSQDGYVKSRGLEKLTEKTDFAVSRLYILPEKSLKQLSSTDLFYRWIRCASDRNIRIFDIKPLQNPERTMQQNFEETCKAVRKFTGYIIKKGFNTESDISIPSDNFHSKAQDCALLINIASAFLVYINSLSPFINKRNLKLYSHLAVLSVTAIFMILYLAGMISSAGLCRIIALSAAVIYPSIAVQNFLEINNINFKGYAYKLIFSLSVLICVNIIGCITVSAALSDITFMMNINTFPGVPAAYIIPLILFVFNYGIVNGINYKNLISSAENKKYFKLKAIPVLLISSFIFTVYITRTGNDPIIPPSHAEINVRKFLEYHLFARPRFKEFLIGYPGVFLFTYFFKKNNRHFILIPLGIMATIGSITTINSFCHVFTPIYISLIRSIYGLILGIITGTLAVALIKVSEKTYYYSFIKKYRYNK